MVFCDGTWNKETSQTPTNVVLAARAAVPVAPDGTDQIIYYDQGVGTTYLINESIESKLAGAFGWGLFDRIADAYRFLVFNYVPGDEIFIFGFSRGAFTARSLAGLIRKCGIIPKEQTHAIGEAYAFYRRDDVKPDDDESQRFRAHNSPLTIMKDLDRDWRRANGFEVPDVPNFILKYLGVWDTVGELGIPKYLMVSGAIDDKYRFHDTALSSTTEAARQALAIDETRLEFEPSPWSNLGELNKITGRESNYQQLWFPGDHGSVGGGGDIVGLSNRALSWVIEGAMRQGAVFHEAALTYWTSLANFKVPLHNSSKPLDFTDRFLYRHGPRTGPSTPDELDSSAKDRLAFFSNDVGWPYRPESLSALLRSFPNLTKPSSP